MTTEIKKILFPTDLSTYARYTFNYAASIASRYGATISILHVMKELPTSVETQVASFMGEKNGKNSKRNTSLLRSIAEKKPERI